MKYKFKKYSKIFTAAKLEDGLRFWKAFGHLYKRGESWVLYSNKSVKTSTTATQKKAKTSG